MPLSDYPYYLQRLIRSTAKNSANGEEEEVFTPGNWLWCRVEWESGRRDSEYGGTQTGADVTVYIRNFPTITAVDRLTDGETVYRIESLTYDTDETIAEAYYLDTGIGT